MLELQTDLFNNRTVAAVVQRLSPTAVGADVALKCQG